MKRQTLDPVDAGKWNGNIHYQRVVLDELPERREAALDVGCGEGILTRQLAPHFAEVVGLDVHADSIRQARALTKADNVRYSVADFMTMPPEAERYDLVSAVVALHQMDLEAALERMKAATRPGGRVVVIGVSAPSYPRDIPRLGVAAVVNRTADALGRRYHHAAPMTWPPPMTDRETKDVADRILPGSTFSRHWLNRYSIVWHKP